MSCKTSVKLFTIVVGTVTNELLLTNDSRWRPGWRVRRCNSYDWGPSGCNFELVRVGDQVVEAYATRRAAEREVELRSPRYVGVTFEVVEFEQVE